jgi:ATP-dependent helicase/nuclease subunit A
LSISRGSGTLNPVPVLTPQQQQAVAAAGNVLVMAGAGTGKTRTLVERCLQRLLDPAHPIRLDQLLVVTFTEAAAAETRLRIRRRLEEAAAAHPADPRLAEAIALADTAHIGTLHGFCLALVREHFHELGLDPQLSVLDPAQAALLAARTLDDLLRRHYAGTAPLDRAVRELVATHGQGRDDVIRASVLRLHEYAQTLPNPAAWLRAQREAGEQTTPEQMWQELRAAFLDWRAEWLERLAELAPKNSKAAAAHGLLAACPAAPDRAQIAAVLENVLALDGDEAWPRGTKTKLRPPLVALFEGAQFLADLAVVQDGADPLAEDWSWVRPHRQALLDLAEEFGRAYADAKRDLAALDFHDLEQFALDLLQGRDRAGLTDLARQWRERFAHVFVDEYQDINAAQDAILRALSRDGPAANRFLVGDVKQSIYRFRLADPRIFQDYARAWRDGPEGVCLPLNENFRSRPAVLEFVNALFAPLMRGEVGGVDYDADAHLRPGRADHPPPGPAGPPVELLLHLTGSDATAPDGAEESADAGDDDDRQATEREAALVAERLRALQAAGRSVWDEAAATWRPVRWSDMVVLLRAPRLRAESYAREFARAGVPLLARRAGLYETPEVRDLLCLLQLLDNPLQDLPLLAVLRSPLVGLDVNELAVIRLAATRERFWTALVRFGEAPAPAAPPAPPGETEPEASARASARPKVDRFLAQFARWRDAARLLPLSQCLELVLEETRYEDGLRLLPRGGARVANVRRLLAITREFDRLQRQGLLRFLQFLEAQVEAEFDPEPAPLDHADAVRLMSIHQSKGLEFPVVVVADLGKPFHTREHTAALMLDEQTGPALRVRPPGKHASYPSLSCWRAERRGRRESQGEELRLLYVALTRARDHLILAGTVSAPKAKKWPSVTEPQCGLAVLLDARCPLDWIGPLMPRLSGDPNWLEKSQGVGTLLTWRVVRAAEAIAPAVPEPAAPATPELDPARLADLTARLAWQYPHRAATREPAKASVSALRRRAVEAADEEAVRWFAEPVPRHRAGEAASGTGLSAVERGVAHHRFLQFADWTALADAAGVRAEAERLVAAGRLTRAEADCLDAAALAALGASELGRAVRADAAWVRRELEFTARLRPADFAALGLPCEPGLGPEEFVVVQGVVDLAVVAPERIWLADFKTDAVTTPEELAARAASYAPQLRLYGLALGRVYARPVTAAWLHFLALNRTVPVALAAG